uniref:Uncharacterized protein n=1 Tax=Marseillevirus LCMAC102 TaxID=2506603 RepID=A0A481YTH6_9VIRU|nr:MAG: hypothetical protein LCMAC102_04090 [Marseillevirus LCMAC102]
MKKFWDQVIQIPFALYNAVLEYIRVIGMGAEDLFFWIWERDCQREMLCHLCAEDNKKFPLTTERILGLRKPGSEGWNDAWVVVKDTNGKITVAEFQNHLDFTSTKYTWHQVLEDKQVFERYGWEIMSQDDIRQIAGV